jgi:hypothetical protein
MDDERFTDPVLELASRCGDYPGNVLEFADTTAEEARQVLEALDEVEAEMAASDIASRLRRQGHTL